MPFDSTRLRQPTHVVHVPPVTPEGGGGRPVRIVLNIEIVGRRGSQNILTPRSRLGTVAWTVFWLIALVVLAHAQPITYEHWTNTTTGAHGEVRRQGDTTDWTSYSADGPHQHVCHQYFVGDQAQISCRRQ
jgi:hypothetical protein